MFIEKLELNIAKFSLTIGDKNGKEIIDGVEITLNSGKKIQLDLNELVEFKLTK